MVTYIINSPHNQQISAKDHGLHGAILAAMESWESVQVTAVPPVTNSKINGVAVAALREAIDAVEEGADPGRRRFRVRNQWLDGGHTRTVLKDIIAPGYRRISRPRPLIVDADIPSLLGNRDSPIDPLEHLLAALAASVTATLVWQAAETGIHIDAIETTVDGDIDLRGCFGLDRDARPGFTHIRIVVAIEAEASAADLDALIDAARMFSPLVDTIGRATPVKISRESLSR